MARVIESRLTEVDAYIGKAAPFAQPVLTYLRELMHEGAPGIVEEMKWSRPFFVYQGVILGNISAFKAHCSLGLWGDRVAGKLREQNVAQDEGMGSFGKITAVDDLPPRKKLLGYIQLAAKAIADGERTKAWSRPKVAKGEPEVPQALALALEKNKAAAAKFAAMTPSCKREYCQWIAEAKRDETRDKRIATALEWISEGKGRHWKYEA
jgi:uncharacterized protein YdeI (YjbR/CyaY-like superfamily)